MDLRESRPASSFSTRYAYASPIGPLQVSVDPRGGVVGIRFRAEATEPLGARYPELANSLDRYFGQGGDLRSVPVALNVSQFRRSVLEALRSIPPGQVRTYSEIARAIGRPEATRAVGGACASNPIPIVIPCHRVIGSSGLGGYQDGLHSKLYLLWREGALPSGTTAA